MTNPESILRPASVGALPKRAASTRFRLTLAFSVLLLPLVAFGILADRQQSEGEETRTRQSLEDLGRIAVQPVEELFSGTERLLRGLIEQSEIRAAGPSCDADLARIRAAMAEYRSLSVLDGTGKVVCSSRPETKGAPFGDVASIGPLLRGDRLAVIARPAGGPPGEAVAVALLPWRDADGTPAGAMAAELMPPRPDAVAADTRLYLLDASGARLDDGRPLPAEIKDPARLAVFLRGGDKLISVGEDAIRWIFVALPVRPGGATALFGIPLRPAPLVERFNLTALAIALWLTGILIAWLVADWIVARPLRRLAGSLAVAREGISPYRGGSAEMAAVSACMTAMADTIATRERELKEAIATREAMLREIHHRVKNNLQIVTSLLNIQAKTVQGEGAGRAFGEIQTRVRALALVHRYLYESDDLKSVNLGAFLKELAASLQLSHGISEEQVMIEVEAEEVWDVSDRAVPLALFMTEAMTNALKHAFPEGRRGLIRVVLRQLGDGVARFSVEDNGVGLSETQNDPQGRQASLGMSLIKAFARQVDGKLTISGPPGTVVAIEFMNKYRPTPPAGERLSIVQTA